MPTRILGPYVVKGVLAAADGLGNACRQMPEDKFAWQPLIGQQAGRSAEDQARECAKINDWFTRAIHIRESSAPSDAFWKSRGDDVAGRSNVLAWLRHSAENLASELEEWTDEDLQVTVPHPFTRGFCTWAEYAGICSWNMVYHEGQVNYIHTLYGDAAQ